MREERVDGNVDEGTPHARIFKRSHAELEPQSSINVPSEPSSEPWESKISSCDKIMLLPKSSERRNIAASISGDELGSKKRTFSIGGSGATSEGSCRCSVGVVRRRGMLVPTSWPIGGGRWML